MTKSFALILAAITLIGAGSRQTAAQASSLATAGYDPQSGDVVVKANDGVFFGGMNLKGPNLIVDPLPSALGGIVDAVGPDEIAWLFGRPKTGEVPLGRLLSPGLSLATLNSEYDIRIDVTGSEYPELNRFPFVLLEVPEPSDCGLLLWSGLALCAVRRRSP
jgi:hypothetical protein